MLSIFPRIGIIIIIIARAVIIPFQVVDDRPDSACGLGGLLKIQPFKQLFKLKINFWRKKL